MHVYVFLAFLPQSQQRARKRSELALPPAFLSHRLTVFWVFQGSQEQREDWERRPGQAEETPGQEGGVLGQPPRALPKPGEVSEPRRHHS